MVGLDTAKMEVECGSVNESAEPTVGAAAVTSDSCTNLRSIENDLFSSDQEKCYNGVIRLKGSLIGSNRQKHLIVERGILPRLISLLGNSESQSELQVAIAQTLGSVAKGMETHLKALIDCGVVPVLLNGLLRSNNKKLTEASLCCLKTIFVHPEVPVEFMYADANIVPHLISLMPHSTANQISVATILTNACKTREHQTILANHGSVRAVNALLCSPYADVQLPALQWLTYLMFSNEQVSAVVISSSYEGHSLIDLVVSLMGRNQRVEMQLHAARCITFLYRCGQLPENDPRVLYKALPTVVRLTQKEECVETRILAAETLAFMIELSAELQRIAAISNHLIPTIASFLWWEPDQTSMSDLNTSLSPSQQHNLNLNSMAQISTTSSVAITSRSSSPPITSITSTHMHHALSSTSTSFFPKPSNGDKPEQGQKIAGNTTGEMISLSGSGDLSTGGLSGLTKYQILQLTKKLDQRANYTRDMKKAAFRVFAALAANDEDIRKRIIETENLMECLVSSLDGGEGPSPHHAQAKLQMAAVQTLHSLSRSVQLLRTTFQDHPVWKPLMKILGSPASSCDFMVVASSTLCNLLLEFSPSKEPILELGAIDLLCSLTHKYEPALVLNGVWGLMNMAFQSDQRIKVQIITTLGSDQIFRLLADQDIQVVMKTLGLLRNLLSNKSQIDHVMNLYGKQIMQAVVFILEGDKVADVKEQALCILANIGDGDTAKSFIMSNEDVLKKITNYMIHTNPKLQMASVVCVHNLSYAEETGAGERQVKLRDIGVYGILQQLLTTTDTALFDKVKGALQQFT